MELYLKNNKLIPEKEWIKRINHLKSRELIIDKEQAKKQLKQLIINSIKKRAPERKFGILFSGGVDSSLIAIIAKKLKKRFICYTVGFQDKGTKKPEDITEAKKVAKRYGFRLKYKVYDMNGAEKIIEKTVKILKPAKKIDVVNVGVGSVILAAIELAKKDKSNHFLSGLGSEEIFAGYERHAKVKEINKECWSGLKKMWSRDLVRDFNLAKGLKVSLGTPFLDEELIEYAMKIPEEWKLKEEKNKIILREIGEEFLSEFAWRKKKAAQYGSCFDKVIKKLAKKSGFKFKKDYLELIAKK